MLPPMQFTERKPLAPVPLPRGGRVLEARHFNLGMQKLATKAQTGDEAAGMELLRRCLPGITDEEIDDLDEQEAGEIIAHCAGKLAEVQAHLKNVAGAAGPLPTSSPSFLTTNTSTPSPALPVPFPAAVAGMTTPTAPSISSSSPSIG